MSVPKNLNYFIWIINSSSTVYSINNEMIKHVIESQRCSRERNWAVFFGNSFAVFKTVNFLIGYFKKIVLKGSVLDILEPLSQNGWELLH